MRSAEKRELDPEFGAQHHSPKKPNFGSKKHTDVEQGDTLDGLSDSEDMSTVELAEPLGGNPTKDTRVSQIVNTHEAKTPRTCNSSRTGRRAVDYGWLELDPDSKPNVNGVSTPPFEPQRRRVGSTGSFASASRSGDRTTRLASSSSSSSSSLSGKKNKKPGPSTVPVSKSEPTVVGINGMSIIYGPYAVDIPQPSPRAAQRSNSHSVEGGKQMIQPSNMEEEENEDGETLIVLDFS